jgi:outer membrane protein OmpA-like peptidoglycan-associated protein
MRNIFRLVVLAGLAAFVLPAAAAPDAATLGVMSRDVTGGADNPMLGRYEGSVLIAQTQKAFDELILPSGVSQGSPWDSSKKFSSTVSPQGRVTRLLYLAPTGRSTLEVATNYTDALKAKGMQQVFACSNACGDAFVSLMYANVVTVAAPNYDLIRTFMIQSTLEYVQDPRYALFKKSSPGGDTYVEVYVGENHGGSHGTYSEALDGRVLALVGIVEPRPMEQKIVTIKASEIAGDVAANGRAAFYGIYFDFNKADVKPESDPQLAEMASYIKQSQGKVFITGHTDNQGGLDFNMALSQKRAEAVVKALVTRFGVDAKRLAPRGLAFLAPLASNSTDDGRAKNRRVELVAD